MSSFRAERDMRFDYYFSKDILRVLTEVDQTDLHLALGPEDESAHRLHRQGFESRSKGSQRCSASPTLLFHPCSDPFPVIPTHHLTRYLPGTTRSYGILESNLGLACRLGRVRTAWPTIAVSSRLLVSSLLPGRPPRFWGRSGHISSGAQQPGLSCHPSPESADSADDPT